MPLPPHLQKLPPRAARHQRRRTDSTVSDLFSKYPFVGTTAIAMIAMFAVLPPIIFAQVGDTPPSPPPPPPRLDLPPSVYAPPSINAPTEGDIQPPKNGMENTNGFGDNRKNIFPMQPPQGSNQMSDQNSQQSEQQSEQQTARMEAQQKIQLQQMKKQMGQFANQIKRIEKKVAGLQAKSVTIPTALSDALAKANALIAQINNATSMSELDDADVPSAMSDIGQTLQEELPNLDRLANLPKIYNRIDKQIAQFNTQLRTAQKLALTSKIDLTDALTDFSNGITTLTSAYSTAKAQIASGDIENGFTNLEENVFNVIPDVAQFYQAIQQIRKLQSSITQISRQLSQGATAISRLKRKGEDTTALETVLADAKQKFADLKTLASAKPFDASAVFDVLNALTDDQQQFQEELDTLTGASDEMAIDAGSPNEFKNFSTPNLKSFFNESR